MNCDSTQTPVYRLIKGAFQLAGAGRGTLNGEDVTEATYILNGILAEKSQNVGIFYDSQVEFITTQDSTSQIIITPTESSNQNYVQANQFRDIFDISYRYGGLDYVMASMNRQEFNAIAFKDTTTYPSVYYYRNEDGKTTVEMYPHAPSAVEFKFFGSQYLSNVNLMSSTAAFPEWARLPLMYELAQHLVNLGKGQPQSGFSQELVVQRMTWQNLVERSLDYDMSQPFVPMNNSMTYGRNR